VIDIANDPSSGGTRRSLCACAECMENAPNDDDEIEEGISDPESNPEDTFLFCPATVFAFSLVKKTWEKVEIDSLLEPKFDEDIFNKLVVDDGHKKVVSAMVQSYLKKENNFSDFVRGKGRGLVILLHGPPGTGKTLTAGDCYANFSYMR
jgi:Cdc6-like AAA superfamily ATPase